MSDKTLAQVFQNCDILKQTTNLLTYKKLKSSYSNAPRYLNMISDAHIKKAHVCLKLSFVALWKCGRWRKCPQTIVNPLKPTHKKLRPQSYFVHGLINIDKSCQFLFSPSILLTHPLKFQNALGFYNLKGGLPLFSKCKKLTTTIF